MPCPQLQSGTLTALKSHLTRSIVLLDPNPVSGPRAPGQLLPNPLPSHRLLLTVVRLAVPRHRHPSRHQRDPASDPPRPLILPVLKDLLPRQTHPVRPPEPCGPRARLHPQREVKALTVERTSRIGSEGLLQAWHAQSVNRVSRQFVEPFVCTG